MVSICLKGYQYSSLFLSSVADSDRMLTVYLHYWGVHIYHYNPAILPTKHILEAVENGLCKCQVSSKLEKQAWVKRKVEFELEVRLSL